MKLTTGKGFTLIETMIVVAIIGILAVIAVPYYQTYLYRARTSELINMAHSAANVVTSAVTEQKLTALPTGSACGDATGVACCGTGSMVSPVSAATNITASVTIADSCVVTAIGVPSAFGNHPPTIILTPTVNTDGAVIWACTSGASKYAPVNCQ